MVSTLSKAFRLASRDYLHEWQMSFCFVLALAAVLGPMMVLFGLKFGIVGAMVDQLIEDPRNREIRPVSSGRYDHAWLEQFARERMCPFWCRVPAVSLRPLSSAANAHHAMCVSS